MTRRTLATIITAATLTAGAGAALADTDAPRQRAQLPPPPALTEAFATAHAVTAIDRNARSYPHGLTVECDRRTRVSFDCRARWRNQTGRTHTTARVLIWLMRHQDSGISAWHYRLWATDRTASGKAIKAWHIR